MVSPSKYCSTPNRDYKVGNQRVKKGSVKSQGVSKPHRSSLRKYQPLSNTKFYLDVRSRVESAKLESTLKAYGAKVDVFLCKDVSFIVTDRTEWIGNGQIPIASVSPITTPSPSSQLDQHRVIPRSRASAMLEKVSLQPSSPYCSPLVLAQKWKIPVFSIPNFWKWIAKIRESVLAKIAEKKSPNRESLKSEIVVDAFDSPFVKIESFLGLDKPELLELKTWPRLHLDGYLGQCPFRSPSPISSSQSEEVNERSKSFEIKDKVTVELIKYDTDIRIKENLDAGGCDIEQLEEVGISKVAEETTTTVTEAQCKLIRSSDICDLKESFHWINLISWFFNEPVSFLHYKVNLSKMTRRLMRNNVSNSEEESIHSIIRQSTAALCNGYLGRTITRQTSQELLKVQCNGLTTSHRNSKLLSPSGSDVLPLPTSRRSTRRASASWCGSTRELSQLSPTDGDIENIRRSESSFESNETSLDSPGITLRPKGQLWLPVALIGTTAEENGNSIRKRYEHSAKQSENAKFCSYILDTLSKTRNNSLSSQSIYRASKGSDSSLNSNFSDHNDYQIRRNNEKKDTYCIITRNAKVKSDEMNGKSRESSVESHKSVQEAPKCRTDGKKRSLSVCGGGTLMVKRSRTVSTNSANSVRKKKLSPEEKLLQDNKEYFKMEVLNTKLRSSGSLLNVNQNRDAEVTGINEKPLEKIEKIIIKKIKVRGRKKKSKWTKTSEKKTKDLDYDTIGDENKEKSDIKLNGIIRKKRQSELTKLCDEAESFMFGESSRYGNASALPASAPDTPKNSAEDAIKRYRIKQEDIEDNSVSNISESPENQGRRRKKRRSHAEAFIHDNIDYYKFETPDSRLRYQGNLIDSKQGDNDFVYTLKDKKKGKQPLNEKKLEQSDGKELSAEIKVEPDIKIEKKRYPIQPSEEIEKLLFSFESIPVTEPWYGVYKRQDEGMENYYPILSDPNDQPFLLPYETPKTIFSRVPEMSDYYKRKKKKLSHLFNHPRKSPRCHASTLAILSSLKKRKRRSGTSISINSVLSEYSQANSSASADDADGKLQESESGMKDMVESEEVLNFLQEDELNEDFELVFLEPMSDTECSSHSNVGDSCKNPKSEEDETKRTGGNRVRKSKLESQSDADDAVDCIKQCSLQSVKTDTFFKDMVFKTRKKSDLNISVTTALEYLRNYKADDGEVDLISEFGDGSIADGLDLRRKKKKARKINKTGWDNRKSRRRIGNKVTDSKVSGDSTIIKPKRIKTKGKLKENGIYEENIINISKRRLRNNIEDNRPMLRSRIDVLDRYAGSRRCSQEGDAQYDSLESSLVGYLPSVVQSKKANETRLSSGVRIKCANGRYGIKSRLVLSKKRAVVDYSWTTKRR